MSGNEVTVFHNKAKQRFEIHIEAHLAELDYQLTGNFITFTHTGVPASMAGHELGSQLVRAGLEFARTNGYKVVPLCSFVAAYINKTPEYRDLLK